ncbi:Putative NADH-flavin reductase [Cedecea neteri]|uniref:NADH-flavin reductase n=1 Tax=Cedecea neteri TaxID=158822 RepID=A0A291E634_9ENTR|nr:NAD(P)H-binding protein [Cedecea neteri]ATF95382.1 hypothetical protein CO704_25140 [Cedecea neteri]SQC91964.1 Putative NADH-flavin reductase [Cedecea neteri]
MSAPSASTLLILGATGKAGGYAVRHALDAHDEVYVFVRNPDKLPADIKARVNVIVGDLTDPAAVADAVKNVSPDAIVVCSDHPRKSRPGPLNVIVIRAIVTALTETHRLSACFVIYLSGLFFAPASDPLPWYFRLMRAAVMPLSGYQAAFRDNQAVTEYLTTGNGRDCGLRFTLIRMGPPVDAASKGRIEPVSNLPLGEVTFDDIGLFMINLAHGEYRENVAGKAIQAFYTRGK